LLAKLRQQPVIPLGDYHACGRARIPENQPAATPPFLELSIAMYSLVSRARRLLDWLG
jgi:hypothetical protein